MYENTEYLTTTSDVHRPFTQTSSNILFKPNFATSDRHVLRFFGYFKESVPESNFETERVRRLIIYLYLVDNSISINEEKQLNSGIPQGSFLARQSVPCSSEPSRFINAWDFRLGQYINIFNKQIFVYNIDDYTRRFFESNNKPQPEPQLCE